MLKQHTYLIAEKKVNMISFALVRNKPETFQNSPYGGQITGFCLDEI